MQSSQPFAALRFATDYGLEQGEVTPKFINVRCWHCGKLKLGLHLHKGYATCYVCGRHDLVFSIAKLLGVPLQEAQAVREAYSYSEGVPSLLAPSTAKSCPIPGEPLTPRYRQYLESRGFDPDWIALEHGVLAAGSRCLWTGESGPTEEWKGSWFSDRLIVPIKDRSGRAVNFQGRSIRKDERVRWKGPPVDRVPVHQKTVLYGGHACTGDTVAVVEGICDQWRLGRGSVATFGTSLTVTQVRLLGTFRRVLFLFDSEPEAQARAAKYAADLGALGRSVAVVDLELTGKRDMADLSEEEARAVRKELGI